MISLLTVILNTLPFGILCNLQINSANAYRIALFAVLMFISLILIDRAIKDYTTSPKTMITVSSMIQLRSILLYTMFYIKN